VKRQLLANSFLAPNDPDSVSFEGTGAPAGVPSCPRFPIWRVDCAFANCRPSTQREARFSPSVVVAAHAERCDARRVPYVWIVQESERQPQAVFHSITQFTRKRRTIEGCASTSISLQNHCWTLPSLSPMRYSCYDTYTRRFDSLASGCVRNAAKADAVDLHGFQPAGLLLSPVGQSAKSSSPQAIGR